MKAEERHRLQQNTLAAGLTKLATETKSASSSFWGVLVLLIVVGVCFWWWTGNTSRRLAATWVDYWDSRSAAERLDFTPKEELEKTMKSFGDKAPAAAARLTYADELYEKGYQTTFRKSPADAAEYFRDASKVYAELAGMSGLPSDVSIRAVIGAAKCEESLGEMDRALHYYEEVIRRFDDPAQVSAPHPLVAEARRRQAQLKSKDGLAFYGSGADRAQWPQRLPSVTRSTAQTPLPSGEQPSEGPTKPPVIPDREKSSEATSKPTTGAQESNPEKPGNPPEKPSNP